MALVILGGLVTSTLLNLLVLLVLLVLARWLYRQLEAEYDHLTSDESIESALNNGIRRRSRCDDGGFRR